MDAAEIDHYLTDIADAKLGNIEVYAGLEVDFIPGIISPIDFKPLLDYTIGSVHFIGGPPHHGFEIDGPFDTFMAGLKNIYKGNIRAAATAYQEITREMIRTGRPDIVGHLDKIKIQNRYGDLFREDEGWWINEIDKTLDEIAAYDCILEVNTRGIYQRKSENTYPSPWVLLKAKARNIRITLSSDAHLKSDLTAEFASTAAILMQLGYTEIHILSQGKWTPSRFNENGLIS